MQTLDQLNESFAIPGVLAFDDAHGGLIRARVTTPSCAAELYLQGAHLTAWQPAGEQPVIFLSGRSAFEPGKPIRGGVPVIFPWFGARTASAGSSRTDGPSHGFGRIQPWQLEFAALAGEDLHLSLTLLPSDLSRSLGYDGFRVAFQFTLGRQLRMRFTVANDGPEALPFEEALHTYLHVGDAQQIRIGGLGHTEFLDKTDNFVRKTQAVPVLTITGETDRPYLNTTAPVTVDDPVLRRRLTVAKSGSNTTVVWNPWSTLAARLPDMDPEGWRTMVCVETANAAENALELRPHQAHVMETVITVDPLA
ncbi:MAG TPA: D-hexose-6-phosphate mutarotase [Acidobacteriaceae bacterium]|jgi:glucose-6-phosphate 1-epimerase|nr:D-hexose-6-phosphate mutarotase [Acidobacteriaceae bacterium]